MRFQVQQCDNEVSPCEDCDDCNAGDFGECIFTTYRPMFLFAKDVVTVPDAAQLSPSGRVLAALLASGVVSDADKKAALGFEILAGGETCTDPYDLDSATTFDVAEEYQGPYRYIVTVI